MSFTLEDLLGGSAEVMGKSTYATYYKTTLGNGDCFVVRLRVYLVKNQREVEVELNLLGKISHRNILTMRAYYWHSEERLLVYDYMPKRSLAAFLHEFDDTDLNARRGSQPQIDWATRMRIAKGVARGLHILHTHHNIIHGNLTSHNVLLDVDINPNISEIGMSRLLTADANSKMIARAGTPGYQAPELSELKKPDMKTDVYSLGVIMLELLTRRSPKSVDLSKRVQMTEPGKRVPEVIDFELQRYSSLEEKIVKMLQLAIDCVSTLPKDRPDVHLVLQQLEEISLETATSSSDDGGAGPSLS
ncbi:putative protein kinase RLK-Pelle-LRR-III family [Helianthus debilis subsp. tardiflorus]